MIDDIDLSGTWRSYYRYPSSSRGKDEFWGVHDLHASRTEDELILITDPEEADAVEIRLKLVAGSNIATGTWREQTDPASYYKGRLYEGTITLTVSADGSRMSGEWQGEGQDGDMNTGTWELVRTPNDAREGTSERNKQEASNSMIDAVDLNGTWRCTYWYPSNERVGDDPSVYTMIAQRSKGDLVFESLPNEDKSYMFIRLKVEDNIANGNWYETTSPDGLFKGAEYSGAGQLVINPRSGNMEGKWVGAGYDHKLKTMRIYTGNWEITHVLDK